MTATPAYPLLLNAAAHPGEWDRLLVLADWHDEHGDPAEALGWRLLAGQRRWPRDSDVHARKVYWVIGAEGGRRSRHPFVLPREVFLLLPRRHGSGKGALRYWPAVPAALADAARAFGLAWLAGWRPKEVQRG